MPQLLLGKEGVEMASKGRVSQQLVGGERAIPLTQSQAIVWSCQRGMRCPTRVQQGIRWTGVGDPKSVVVSVIQPRR